MKCKRENESEVLISHDAGPREALATLLFIMPFVQSLSQHSGAMYLEKAGPGLLEDLATPEEGKAKHPLGSTLRQWKATIPGTSAQGQGAAGF